MENRPTDTSRMTPMEKLDAVLAYMETVTMPPFRTFTEAQQELREKGLQFGAYSDELLRILMKLEADSNVHTELDSKGIKRYYPNFDGSALLASGGYVGRERRAALALEAEKMEAARRRRMDRWMAVGTVAAAVVGAPLLTVEVVKYLQGK